MRDKIYILGKVTGEERVANLRKFEDACRDLYNRGYHPVNPMVMIYPHKNKTYLEKIKESITHMMKCTHIYMLKDYKSSNGSMMLLRLATDLKMPVIYE